MFRRGIARRTLHDVRTASELAHVRPAYAGGIRAAIATVTPLLLVSVLPPGAATWASLAGLNGALIDRGGPYRLRARTMAALAASSALAVMLGSIVAGHLVLSVIVTFAVALACGLARAWIDVGPGFGITTLVTYAIALAIPVTTGEAIYVRGAFILAGGMWAMILAIFLWPLRPYRPVRLRVAECYRAIARYAEAAAVPLADGEPYDPWQARSYLVAVRAAIEAARASLALSRRGRAAESGRGERLLVLHEVSDQLFAHVIALLEEGDAPSDALSDAPSSSGAAAGTRRTLAAVLTGIAATLRAIADAVESEVDLARIPVEWPVDALRACSRSLGEIVQRIADYAATASAIIASLNSGDPIPAELGNIDVAEPPPEPVLFSLAAVLRPSSVVLHHALRVAIVTTTAVLLTGVLQLNHGYWVTLTAVVILQPFAATTRQKALQRVIGTILGGMVAAGLSALFHSPIAVLVLVAIFTMLCVALLPLNYGAYAVFGTPAFVLLAEASAGDWHLARLRILNTLLGGALALVGAQLLWPGEERNRLPELAAAAIRANREFLQRAIALVADRGSGDLGILRDARRGVAVAALDAEDSFQRLVSEHRGPPESLEPMMAILVYTRRLAGSTAAFALSATGATRPSEASLAPFAHASSEVLEDLAQSVLTGSAPRPFPAAGSIPMPGAGQGQVVHQRVTRLARQLALMHDAVDRWVRLQSA
ncbi:MAG: hypothetical protein JWO05_858 [Gemmatimonadetes bacterium]|nr:hypothetical protein [Gemmatimonadota bacterium]